MFPSTSLTNVFEAGSYTTHLQSVQSGICTSNPVSVAPPKPLLIASPLEAGEFPILLFLHGYLLYNSFYSQLMHHIASHGFVVIAPQLYKLTGPDTGPDLVSAAAVTNWLAEGLSEFLPQNIRPDLGKIALAGHSRGGKEAFALALRKQGITTNLKYSALIAIDPVDGMQKGVQTPPPVLTYVPHSFDFNMPALVIGSGLGHVKRNPLFPPCAPEGVNHHEFFLECRKPAWHFVAKDYGHLDLLDDDTKGFVGKATYCLCVNGESRKPMRTFVGGAIVAFLNAYLNADHSDLLALVDNKHHNVPVDLEFHSFL